VSKPSQYILALDSGTTSCRAILFNHEGQVFRKAQAEFTQYYPHSGWVEHDAEEIWQTQLKMMRQVTEGVNPKNIVAMGIANQRETIVFWDPQTGMPLHRAIVWQCRRSGEICDRLRATGMEAALYAKTGLRLDPYFSATKIMWLFEQHPQLRHKAEQGQLICGTVDSWLIWKLTEGRVHATDSSNASRTMLFNIHTMQWDDEILAELHICPNILPEVKPSGCLYGFTSLLGAAIPISAAIGDQQAALFGSGCFAKGMAKNTYGTGCFLLSNTGDQPVYSQLGLLTTIAWELNGQIHYALEGSVFIAGAAIQWLRDGLGLIEHANETEALANSVTDTKGVYFIPAFNGLGAPYWNPNARGVITGLSLSVTKPHLVRAALEAIAYQSADVLRVMNLESTNELTHLKVDGGAAQNDFLLQFQSDVLNVPIFRAKIFETTALGAAYMAGLVVGFWQDTNELTKLWELDQPFHPNPDPVLRENRLHGWRKAIEMLMND